jgi:hypothetical protein
MISIAEVLQRKESVPMCASSGTNGIFGDAIFELDGLSITGLELLNRFPRLAEFQENLAALEVAATAYLVLRLLKGGRSPRLLVQAAKTPIYSLIKTESRKWEC